MRLDHFVVHIDGPDQLPQLKASCERAGFPFDLRYGKGTRGFRANYLWIGDEYFEIVWLKSPDGGGWQHEWVSLYNAGKRGLFCIFIETENLEVVQEELKSRGVATYAEQTTFRICFGLLKLTMPWRYLVVPKIPGTDIQLNFFEYSPGAKKKYRPRMKPNSRENGIDGIPNALISLPDWKMTIPFLQNIFPTLTVSANEATLALKNGNIRFAASKESEARVQFNATSHDPANVGKSFTLKNIDVTVAAT